MGRIHVLPDEIVSRIAAGEVIERPSSVVKELVENSIDAGTDRIEVHLEEAGRRLLRVRDRGRGMDREDLEQLFQRHATSKIRSASDLNGISSLGFRGEALYSIGAVSDVVLRSRTRDADAAWQIHVRGATRVDLRPAAAPAGTDIEVRELFFNTPARRKFLKSDAAEMRQIVSTLLPYAISHPRIHFLLVHNRRTLLEIPPDDGDSARMARALSLNPPDLLEALEELPECRARIRLVLGTINIQRPRRDMQFVLVNRRPVQSRLLSHVLNDAYRLILPAGTHPCFALHLFLPVDQVDVNSHPTKREVRLRGEERLATAVRSLCERTLMEKGPPRQFRAPGTLGDTSPMRPAAPGTAEPPSPYHAPGTSEPLFGPEEPLIVARRENLRNRLSLARYCGGFFRRYVVFETPVSVLLMDQHAAHERIVFERLRRQIEEKRLDIQQMLTPVLMKLSPEEWVTWESGSHVLEQAGLSTTRWDRETLAVHSCPQLIQRPDIAVRNILAGNAGRQWNPDSLARAACRQSVMSGDIVHQEEAERLSKDLLACEDPFTCPHGRPTVIELSEEFLNRQFLR